MKKRLVIFLITIFCFVLMLEPISVLAVENINNDESKTLTIYYYVQRNGIDKAIKGAKIGINKIADIDVVNQNIVYNVVEKYSDLKNTQFDGLKVSESIELAKKFNDITKSYDDTGVTDSEGLVTFDITENGVYLVSQLDSVGVAEGYLDFEPYIILVPFTSKETDGWIYKVLSEPKTAVVLHERSETSEESEHSEESKTTEDSKPNPSGDGVETGDNTPYALVGVIVWCSLALIVLLISSRKRGQDEE